MDYAEYFWSINRDSAVIVDRLAKADSLAMLKQEKSMEVEGNEIY